MEETLKDIKTKLEGRFYQNEEHVRFSIVARILQKLGWDIWNPQEVNPEFYGTPNEDKTRIDMALGPDLRHPSVFIEVKSVGKIDATLSEVERQLRDYNRDLTAIFSIITDGQKWRFYSSRTGGEFSEKCFKVIDLLKDDLSTVENSLKIFLAKSEIMNGNAEKNANNYLQLNQKQRAIEKVYSLALDMINKPPFPSLPQALVELVALEGYTITSEEAKDFIVKWHPPTTDFPRTRDSTNDRGPLFPPPPVGRKMKIRGELFEIPHAYDILVETANWLIKNGKLKHSDSPLSIGSVNNDYLINKEPKNRDGSEFRASKQLKNGLWIMTNKSRPQHIEAARRLLEKCGERADALIIE